MAMTLDEGVRQSGVSKIGSSSTPDTKLDEYRDTFEQMKARCLPSMALRIPVFERELGRKLRRVCEIGCANGVGYFPFRDRGIEWLGLDTNPRWVRHGAERGIPVEAIDLEQVEGSFDLIYAQQVLEHIDEPLPFLTMIRKKLAPGGLAHMAVPNHAAFTAIKRRLIPQLSPMDYGFIQYPYHLRAYNKRSLRTLFERAGFENPQVRVINHIDLRWGEWDAHSAPLLNRLVFGTGGALGLGTLLFGVARAPD